jgi:hypothetical protein
MLIQAPVQPPGPRRQALALIGAGLLLCSVSLALLAAR